MTAILGTAFFTSISSKLKWQNRFNANLHYLIKRKASNIFFVMITQFRWYLTEPLFWCFNPSPALKRYPHPHKCTFIVGLICPPPTQQVLKAGQVLSSTPIPRTVVDKLDRLLRGREVAEKEADEEDELRKMITDLKRVVERTKKEWPFSWKMFPHCVRYSKMGSGR